MQPASELFVKMIILFAVGVILLIAFYMRDKILIPIKSQLTSSRAKTVVGTMEGAYAVFDNVFFFIAIGTGIAVVLMAYMTHASPAFLFFAIILFAIALIIIPQFANIWQDIAEKPKFSKYANSSSSSELFKTYKLFESFPTFFWIFGFLILVVLFAKVRTGGGSV